MTVYHFEPIGRISSCFTEKFGIPRQPNLVPEAEAHLEMAPSFQQAEAFRELEHFSHLWILFVFHQCYERPWHPTVRPPRLGGNRRVGVFASRSGFRPNAIGQSVVALKGIETAKGQIRLHLGGVDLLDGTPVLDIKPYLPYADSISEARSGYAPEPPQPMEVHFSPQAEQACADLDTVRYPNLRRVVAGLLAQDPRPAYKNSGGGEETFGMRLWDLNVRFTAQDGRIVVTNVEATSE